MGAKLDSALAWDTMTAFYNGVALLKRDAFRSLLIPLYGGDGNYVEGIWSQFHQHPWGFCRNRNPEAPGRALFALCLELGARGDA